MISYSIKDLEKITGIKAHTIRIWEKRYCIVQPSRTKTNIRSYSDNDLRRLMNVAILNKFGYKISNIKNMTENEINRRILELTQQDIDNDHLVDSLVMSMMEMDEQRFEGIFSSAIVNIGFENTIDTLLQRFLEKIGVLWQTGTITPAQEHFISNLIRQKLILAIDGLHETKSDNKTFLLFLPENEYHEMALLYFQFLIRKQGHQIIYLGQNVPLANLKGVSSIRPVDFLLTSVSANITNAYFSEFIGELSDIYKDTSVLIGGSCLQNITVNLPPNFITFQSIPEFSEFLNKL